MEIQGKIINVLPERSGVGQRTGTPWKAGSFVIETIEQFPKKCMFDVFGEDRLKQFNIQVGQLLTVSIDIDAHEYNGRWFNSIRAWKVEPWDPTAVPTAPADSAAAFPPPAQPVADAPFSAAAPVAPAAPDVPAAAFQESTDDLPF